MSMKASAERGSIGVRIGRKAATLLPSGSHHRWRRLCPRIFAAGDGEKARSVPISGLAYLRALRRITAFLGQDSGPVLVRCITDLVNRLQERHAMNEMEKAAAGLLYDANYDPALRRRRVASQRRMEPPQTMAAPCQKDSGKGVRSSTAASAADSTGVK